MSKKNYLFLISGGIILFVAAGLFSAGQTQATTYKISYDSTSFYVNSLQIDVTWKVIGWGGSSGPPRIWLNGGLPQQYGFSPPGTEYQFQAQLQLGSNEIAIFSDNWSCDACGCGCDGVNARITFANGSKLYTDASWEGQELAVWAPAITCNSSAGIDGSSYLNGAACFDCCMTMVRKIITVENPPVTPKYKCEGINCKEDDTNGAFLSSDCDNTCTATPKYKCLPNGSCKRDDTNGTYNNDKCDNKCTLPPPSWTEIRPF